MTSLCIISKLTAWLACTNRGTSFPCVWMLMFIEYVTKGFAEDSLLIVLLRIGSTASSFSESTSFCEDVVFPMTESFQTHWIFYKITLQ